LPFLDYDEDTLKLLKNYDDFIKPIQEISKAYLTVITNLNTFLDSILKIDQLQSNLILINFKNNILPIGTDYNSLLEPKNIQVWLHNLKKLIDEIDKWNECTNIGTLEFMDLFCKFNRNEYLCESLSDERSKSFKSIYPSWVDLQTRIEDLKKAQPKDTTDKVNKSSKKSPNLKSAIAITNAIAESKN